jgi:hypothetical protein
MTFDTPGIEAFQFVHTGEFEILDTLTIDAIARMILEASLQNRHDVCVLLFLRRKGADWSLARSRRPVNNHPTSCLGCDVRELLFIA